MYPRILYDIRTSEPVPSNGLAQACEHTIEAALDIEMTLQGKDDPMTEVAQLARILDTERKCEWNTSFFQKVLRETGRSGLRTVSDVQTAMQDIVREIRTIEVFRVGDLEGMQAFCLELNKALVAAAWQKLMEHRHIA